MDRTMITKKELERMYLGKKMSSHKIAADIGCTPVYVCNLLSKFGIPTRKTWLATPINKQMLEKTYLEKKMSMVSIASEFNVSTDTVRRKLITFGIPVRKGAVKRLPIKRQVVEKMYVKQDMTIREIAAELNTSYGTILRKLLQHGIPLRPGGARKIPIARSTLERMYIKKRMTVPAIAAELNVHESTIFRKVKEFDLRLDPPRIGRPRKQ